MEFNTTTGSSRSTMPKPFSEFESGQVFLICSYFGVSYGMKTERPCYCRQRASWEGNFIRLFDGEGMHADESNVFQTVDLVGKILDVGSDRPMNIGGISPGQIYTHERPPRFIDSSELYLKTRDRVQTMLEIQNGVCICLKTGRGRTTGSNRNDCYIVDVAFKEA